MKGLYRIRSITLAACAALLALEVFYATAKVNYWSISLMLLGGHLLAISLLLAHIYQAVWQPAAASARTEHLLYALTLGLIVFAVGPLTISYHEIVLTRSFLTDRFREYESMAAHIVARREDLSSRIQGVGSWVHRPSVYARTNKDGSIIIFFHGRVNGGWLDAHRVGYMYHTGKMLPTDKEAFFTREGMREHYLHLTNFWYAF